jgi:hypothetical protein
MDDVKLSSYPAVRFAVTYDLVRGCSAGVVARLVFPDEEHFLLSVPAPNQMPSQELPIVVSGGRSWVGKIKSDFCAIDKGITALSQPLKSVLARLS